jgi:hypothetical protein
MVADRALYAMATTDYWQALVTFESGDVMCPECYREAIDGRA